MIKSRKIFYIICLLFASLWLCLSHFIYDKPIVNKPLNKGDAEKLSPEQLITVYYKDNFYRIPAGYMILSPNIDSEGINYFNGEESVSSLGLSILMPDVRHKTKQDNCRSPYDKCLSDKDYIVEVVLMNLSLDNVGKVTPSIMCKRQQEWGKEKNTLILEDRYGLSKFYNTTDTGVVSASEYYCSKEGYVPQVNIDCSKLGSVPKPTCKAQLYYPDEDMYFWMLMPSNHVQEWLEQIKVMRNLLQEWRIKDINEIENLNKTMQSQELIKK